MCTSLWIWRTTLYDDDDDDDDEKEETFQKNETNDHGDGAGGQRGERADDVGLLFAKIGNRWTKLRSLSAIKFTRKWKVSFWL